MDNQVVDLEEQSLQVDTQAQTIVITNQNQYDNANSFLKTIKELQAQVKDTFGPIISKAFQAHKEAKAQETKHLEPLVKAESLVKSKMTLFLREQEAIREAQERKLREEAEKKRQEALAKAELAKANGKEAKAEKYIEKANGIIAPTLAPMVDKGSVTIKKLYHAEVYDLMALVKAIAEGKASISLIEANMPVLNAQARALKETMNYPGVKVVAEDNLSTRRDK